MVLGRKSWYLQFSYARPTKAESLAPIGRASTVQPFMPVAVLEKGRSNFIFGPQTKVPKSLLATIAGQW
jgi:hypothetical protein